MADKEETDLEMGRSITKIIEEASHPRKRNEVLIAAENSVKVPSETGSGSESDINPPQPGVGYGKYSEEEFYKGLEHIKD